MAMERTFVAIKPDAIKRCLVHVIFEKFERKGFKLVAIKMAKATDDILDQQYAEHQGKAFFFHLKSFMKTSPLIIMVWEGPNVISQIRKMIGDTNPLVADVGTLRGDFATCTEQNIIHASDSPEAAKKEIALWFTKNEIF